MTKTRLETIRRDLILPGQSDAAVDAVDLTTYRGRTVDLVKHVWAFESATRRTNGEEYQFSIMRDVDRFPRVAVRSGHGVGKTTTDVLTALAFSLTRPFSRVIVVMPEFSRQVRSIFFSEVRKWVRRAKVPLPVEVLANRVLVGGHGDEWSIIGLPATEPDRIEGFHSDEGGVLLILDETKGVPDECYDALMGALTGHGDNRLLLTSTPGGPAGVFHNIFRRADDDWRLHHIPSTDSSLVSKKWVKQREREWGGRESSLFQTRVLGNFAASVDEGLVNLDWLERAAAKWDDAMLHLERAKARGTLPEPVMGIDPAWHGVDNTTLALRRGNTLVKFVSWNGLDTMQSVQRIEQEALKEGLRPWTVYAEAYGRLVVDSIGIGAGILDRLKEKQWRVHAFNGGFKPGRRDRFLNGRAESYWHFRTLLEENTISIPRDEELWEEILSVKWGATGSNQIQLESKAELKRRIGRSPDKADAATMAFYKVADGFYYFDFYV